MSRWKSPASLISRLQRFRDLIQFPSEGTGYMAKERLVIIGGDAAGMSTAAQAKRLRPDLDIIAFEKGPHTSYSA